MNMLPPRIPKKAKRATRWRSQAHCNDVRQHACSNCGSMAGIEALIAAFCQASPKRREIEAAKRERGE